MVTCKRMGHYANECRTREHNLSNFRNPTNNREFRPKQEYSGNNVKF